MAPLNFINFTLAMMPFSLGGATSTAVDSAKTPFPKEKGAGEMKVNSADPSFARLGDPGAPGPARKQKLTIRCHSFPNDAYGEGWECNRR
jgi:hypothetical protein